MSKYVLALHATHDRVRGKKKIRGGGREKKVKLPPLSHK